MNKFTLKYVNKKNETLLKQQNLQSDIQIIRYSSVILIIFFIVDIITVLSSNSDALLEFLIQDFSMIALLIMQFTLTFIFQKPKRKTEIQVNEDDTSIMKNLTKQMKIRKPELLTGNLVQENSLYNLINKKLKSYYDNIFNPSKEIVEKQKKMALLQQKQKKLRQKQKSTDQNLDQNVKINIPNYQSKSPINKLNSNLKKTPIQNQKNLQQNKNDNKQNALVNNPIQQKSKYTRKGSLQIQDQSYTQFNRFNSPQKINNLEQQQQQLQKNNVLNDNQSDNNKNNNYRRNKRFFSYSSRTKNISNCTTQPGLPQLTTNQDTFNSPQQTKQNAIQKIIAQNQFGTQEHKLQKQINEKKLKKKIAEDTRNKNIEKLKDPIQRLEIEHCIKGHRQIEQVQINLFSVDDEELYCMVMFQDQNKQLQLEKIKKIITQVKKFIEQSFQYFIKQSQVFIDINKFQIEKNNNSDNQCNPDNLNLNEIFKIQKSQYLDENSQPPQEREYCEVYYLIFTIYSQNYYFEKVLLKTIFQQNKLIRPKSNSHQNSQEVNINKEINFFYKIFHKYISAKGIILSGVKYSCENQSIFAKTDKKMLQLLIFNLFQVICIIQGAEYKISVQTVKDENIENVQIIISTYDKQVIKNLSSQSSTNNVQNQQIINIKQYLLICGSILSEIGPNGEVNLHYQESSEQPFQMKLNLYQDIKVINLSENPKQEDLNSNIGIIEQFIHAGRETSQREINLQQQNQNFKQNKNNLNQKYPPIHGQGQMNKSPQNQKKNLLVSNFIGNLNQSFMPNMLDYKQDENKLKKLKKITFQGENQETSILKSVDDFDIKLRQSTQQNLQLNKKNPENQLLKSPKNQLATSIYDKNINFDSNNSLKKVRENQIKPNPQKYNNNFKQNPKINVNLNINQKQNNFEINEESQEEFSPQKQDHLLQNYNYNNNIQNNNNSYNYNINNNYPPLSMDQSQSQQLISNTNTNIQLAKFNSKNSQGHINLNIQNLSHNFNNQSSNIQTNNNSNIFDFSYNNSSNQSPQIRYNYHNPLQDNNNNNMFEIEEKNPYYQSQSQSILNDKNKFKNQSFNFSDFDGSLYLESPISKPKEHHFGNKGKKLQF